jgi:hypothetical protein
MPASRFVVAAFVVIPLVLVAALVAGSEWAGRRLGEDPGRRRRWRWITAGGSLLWLAATGVAAQSGVLRRWDAVPPPFAAMPAAILVLGVVVAASALGTRLARGLPLAALVGVQAFRLPLELVMHRAYEEGIMPVQMSYSGRNFDIVTGITAALLGAWLARRPVPGWVVGAWNLLGLALLVNVVTVAILATPVFRWFGDEHLNVWVTYPPFVWLPAVMVTAAWAGHLVIWRRLRRPA